MRNPSPRNGILTGKKLMEVDSDWQDQNEQKIFQTITISGSAIENLPYYESQVFFKKSKYVNVIKIENKPDPELFQPSFLSEEIKKTPKSRETIQLRNFRFQNLFKC
jgi:hypothetical protein